MKFKLEKMLKLSPNEYKCTFLKVNLVSRRNVDHLLMHSIIFRIKKTKSN